MATARSTWKARERQAAAIFGARRNVLSGSANRDDRDTSDSTHPRLHIECKLRAKHAAIELFGKTRKIAKLKPTVLMLAQKNLEGFLICISSYQIDQVVREWLAAQTDEELCVIERDVRVLRGAE